MENQWVSTTATSLRVQFVEQYNVSPFDYSMELHLAGSMPYATLADVRAVLIFSGGIIYHNNAEPLRGKIKLGMA